ncbi:MAG: HAD family hydrolase [Polyangiaceae bacterium]|nr:HAD family hydrolase [Polyangiaceae bacterium]
MKANDYRRASKEYRAWLVDLDGTLYRSQLVKLTMAAELALAGLHRINTLKSFRQIHEELRVELQSEPERSYDPSPFAEQIRRTALSSRSKEEDVEKIVREWMLERPGKWLKRARRPELIRAIEGFRRRGGKTAVVSDYPAEEKLEALEIRSLFDVVVTSGEHPEVRRLKPAPDSLLIAARELDQSASDCLVIGDREDADGAAAQAAGMDFHLVG